MRKIDRTGERFRTKEELGGYEIIIIEYNNNKDVTIQFQDEYKTILEHYSYEECRRGSIKNPYHPSVYQHGFIGEGEYKSVNNGKKTECYKDWQGILQRGFDKEFKEQHLSYKDIIVNPELYNFQDFAKWWHNNYYEVEGEQMCVDKDILVKGNKEYRFDRMIFVPQRINKLFIKCNATRGDLPIGVCYHKRYNVYQANCNTLEGKKYLGSYNTPHEAFLAYKKFKEQYIKQVADEYKNKIPRELYDAMYRWIVEEND